MNLAAQVLSATVAYALEHVYGENVKCTVDFIRVMNSPYLAPFFNSADERLVWLDKYFMQYLKVLKDAVNNRPGLYN